jgi:hypothetical protein
MAQIKVIFFIWLAFLLLTSVLYGSHLLLNCRFDSNIVPPAKLKAKLFSISQNYEMFSFSKHAARLHQKNISSQVRNIIWAYPAEIRIFGKTKHG